MNIEEIRDIVSKEGIVFLTYGGFLSQALIAGMTEALEKEASTNDLPLGDSNNIFTIFIELSQNMMNYSKAILKNSNKVESEGLIVVGKNDDNTYFIQSQNVVSGVDKEKIEPKLINIQSLNRDEIKKKYRELRRSGKNTHHKGGGIGFYEIGKRADKIEYGFRAISEDKYYFQFKAYIKVKKK
jgi:hypothetical protein